MVHSRFSFLFSFLVSLLFAYFLATALTPPVDPTIYLTPEVLARYPISAGMLRPEPHEFTRFVFFWCFFLASFLFLFLLIEKFLNKPTHQQLGKNLSGYTALLVSGLGITLLLYCLFRVEWDYRHTHQNRFYIRDTLLNANVFVLLFVIFLIAAMLSFLFLAPKKWPWMMDKRWHWFLCVVIASAVTAYAVFFICKPNPFYAPNALYHDSYYFTSIYNVYYGASIGVEAESIYGGHAYFIVPLLRLIGFTYHRFIAVIAVLCAVIFAALFLLSKSVAQTPMGTLFTCVFVLYVMVFYAFAAHGGYYFYQQVPHRVIFPVTMLCYISLEKHIRNRKSLYDICGYFLASLAIVMNIESGLAALGAFFVSRLTRSLLLYNLRTGKLWRSVLFNFGACGASISGFFGIMWLIAFIRSGESIALARLYNTQFTFAQLGNGMLPLPDGISMYMPVFAICAFSVAYIVQYLIKNTGKGRVSHEHTFIVALCATGIISLVYYVGRSDTRTLIPVAWPAQFMLCYFVGKLLRRDFVLSLGKLERFSVKLFAIPICLLIAIYALSIPYTIGKTETISSYIRAQRTHTVPESFQNDLGFIKKYTALDKTINLVGVYASVALADLGIRNTYLGETANVLYTWEAYEFLLSYVNHIMGEGGALILDNFIYEELMVYCQEEFLEMLSVRGYAETDRSPSYRLITPN